MQQPVHAISWLVVTVADGVSIEGSSQMPDARLDEMETMARIHVLSGYRQPTAVRIFHPNDRRRGRRDRCQDPRCCGGRQVRVVQNVVTFGYNREAF
jgi:hypothetical protein